MAHTEPDDTTVFRAAAAFEARYFGPELYSNVSRPRQLKDERFATLRSLQSAKQMAVRLRTHRLEEERWFGSRTGEHPVFTRSSGERLDPSNVSRLFHRLVREAGVPRIRFHDLRHTAASLLIHQGVPAKVVSDRLGHADVAFTLSVYTHLYDDQHRAGAIPLSQLLSESPSSAPSSRQSDELVAQLQQLIATLLKQN